MNIKHLFILPPLFMFLSGCSTDVLPSTTTLTTEQANAIAHEIAVRIDNNFFEAIGDPLSSGTIPVDRTDGCIHSTGTVNEGTNSSFTFALSHTDCVATVAVDNAVTYSGTLQAEGGKNDLGKGNSRYFYTVSGSVDVSGSAVTAGTCGIGHSVALTFDSNLNGSDPNVSGTICDTAVTVALLD